MFIYGSYIACIIIVMGAQQKHKGMFLKHEVGGQTFSYSVVGEWFFPHVFSRIFSQAFFFLPIDFAKPHTPSPAIINERSLTKKKRERMWITPVYYFLWCKPTLSFVGNWIHTSPHGLVPQTVSRSPGLDLYILPHQHTSQILHMYPGPFTCTFLLP